MSRALFQHRRSELEARIEEMIALLDFIDGDPDLEDNGDDEPEETDQNGDEGDYSATEDGGFGGLAYDGSGVDIAQGLVKGLPTFHDRAAFKEALAKGFDPNRSEIEKMRR